MLKADQMKILREVPALLLAWYSQCRRVLPWREQPEPYRVWVSEIMLQQTRVNAVLPYFERFIQALPSVEALAHCEDSQLFKLWEGLGYYNRARNLKKAAGVLMERYQGTLPVDYTALLALPGIGEYTAGAICSIAYQMPYAAVDGNVLRVMARVLNLYRDTSKQKTKRELADSLCSLGVRRMGDLNQALMELGALICLPGEQAKCGDCPLQGICRAYALGTAVRLPRKPAWAERKEEERTVLLLICKDKIALYKRPEEGLLAGMWEFPNLSGRLQGDELEEYLQRQGLSPIRIEALGSRQHLFTHRIWKMSGFLVVVEAETPNWRWVTHRKLKEQYSLPAAFQKFLPRLPVHF